MRSLFKPIKFGAGFLAIGVRSSGAVAWVALVLGFIASPSRAELADEGWGDLGYSKTEPLVEALPLDMGTEIFEPSPQALAAAADSTTPSAVRDREAAPESSPDSRPNSSPNKNVDQGQAKNAGRGNPGGTSGGNRRGFTKISTLQNTHGVLTEQMDPLQFYLSPIGGVSALVGNSTVEASGRFAVGGQAGFLLGSNFLLNVSYLYSEFGLSGPRSNSTSLVFGAPQDVYRLKSNHIELGGRMFFLGRESRVRPFFGGGFGWGKSYLNYTAANLQALSYQPGFVQDLTLNQFDAFGEVGTEVAVTRKWVIHASFRLRGVLGGSNSIGSDADAGSYDVAKRTVGESLGQTASYTLGAGLGIYF